MGLDATVKRLSPALVAVMLVIIAYFQAVGLGRVLHLALGSPLPAHGPRSLVHRRAPAPDEDHSTSAAAILARNPFDSVTGPLDKAPPRSSEPEAKVVDGQDPYADPQCAGARVMLIASSADPAWSFAAIAGADGKTVMRRRGEEVDGQTVEFVGDLRPEDKGSHDEGGVWDRVWLRGASGRCQLALGQKPLAAAKGPVKEPPKDTPKGTSPLADKIHQRGDHAYDVDRSAVEAILGNPAELMRVQAFPVKDGERVLGLRLRGIRPGSLLSLIGIQNNDMLTAVNGFEMNDPQKMIEAYTKLMKADRLTATVVRGGQPVNIDYAIK